MDKGMISGIIFWILGFALFGWMIYIYNTPSESQIPHSSNTYNASFYGYECTQNCSGHKAGWEWAENKEINDSDDCGGKSQSFIEGCWAYVEYNY